MDYKTKKKVNKILDFLDTLPGIELFKNNYFFSEATIEVIEDFLKTNKNYKYYPWLEKIFSKKIELFGV